MSRDGLPELSLPSRCRTKEAEVIFNARVAIDPARLEELVRTAAADAGEHQRVAVTFQQTQSFRPSRPIPTHRFSAVGQR